ncbi:MAG TPA: exopolysaccharide biosynthesis protein [Caulobacteraceae bacterium]|jgi:hypothetical protein
MNPRPPPHEHDPRPLSEVLRELAGRSGDPELRVGEVIDTFDERAFGGILIFLGLLSLIPIPGATTLTGIPLIFVAVQLIMGRETLWLPRKLLRSGVSRANFCEGLQRWLRWIEKAERLTKPRMRWATSTAAERLIGLVCLVMALVLVLPLWFGNLLPAIAVILLSLALLQRDGVLVLMGFAAAIGSFVVLFLVWGTVVAGVVGTWEWIVTRF